MTFSFNVLAGDDEAAETAPYAIDGGPRCRVAFEGRPRNTANRGLTVRVVTPPRCNDNTGKGVIDRVCFRRAKA
jgi:hypothetical protein